jgi:hydroxybutyrate-dimer hydrolase
MAQAALDLLQNAGWSESALEAGALSVAFDLWRAVGVGYASAYTRSHHANMPCGYRYAMLNAAGEARAGSRAEQSAWWSDSSGIPPSAGVGIIDSMASGSDPSLPGLNCLRDLWAGTSEASSRLRDAVDATRVGLPRSGLPIIVIHGVNDGLVPESFSGGAYAQWVASNGGQLSYWRVENAQHFDAFLGIPLLASRYVPLLPFAYRALDMMWQRVFDDAAMPAWTPRLEFRARARSSMANGVEALTTDHLRLD